MSKQGIDNLEMSKSEKSWQQFYKPKYISYCYIPNIYTFDAY